MAQAVYVAFGPNDDAENVKFRNASFEIQLTVRYTCQIKRECNLLMNYNH